MADLITYDATVVTGLERLAAKECQEKLSVCDMQQSPGHVLFKSPDRYKTLSKLHSVDNIYVVISHNVPLANPSLVEADSSQLEQVFEQAVEGCDWNLGLQVWMEATGFIKCDLATILDRRAPSETNLKPSFRASCNRTGGHKYTSQTAASIFGGLINDKFHWPVSLKNFDVEILLTIKENSLRIALCLSKESLYKRYIVAYGVTSLRGTIAFNLIQIADLQPGDIVCDPLCGSGVIPVETAISWPHTFVLAGDNFPVAIEKTAANCDANNLCQTSLVQWDSTRLPLREQAVDAFITDLPFGKRLGSKHLNRTLYPALLVEMIRCARLVTGRIVLLTQDKQNANRCLNSDLVRKYCKHEKSFYVNMGGLDSSIYLLKRNATPFEHL